MRGCGTSGSLPNLYLEWSSLLSLDVIESQHKQTRCRFASRIPLSALALTHQRIAWHCLCLITLLSLPLLCIPFTIPLFAIPLPTLHFGYMRRVGLHPKPLCACARAIVT